MLVEDNIAVAKKMDRSSAPNRGGECNLGNDASFFFGGM